MLPVTSPSSVQSQTEFVKESAVSSSLINNSAQAHSQMRAVMQFCSFAVGQSVSSHESLYPVDCTGRGGGKEIDLLEMVLQLC